MSIANTTPDDSIDCGPSCQECESNMVNHLTPEGREALRGEVQCNMCGAISDYRL